MFEFLDDAVDLLDRVADGGRLVRSLLVVPLRLTLVFAARWFAMGFLVVFVPLFLLVPLLGLFAG